MKRIKISKKQKIMVAKFVLDAAMKLIGVTCFFLGIGGLAEMPTDPKQIVQALGLFILGLCIVGYNSYLIDKKGNRK